jgi:hypothetical protein
MNASTNHVLVGTSGVGAKRPFVRKQHPVTKE